MGLPFSPTATVAIACYAVHYGSPPATLPPRAGSSATVSNWTATSRSSDLGTFLAAEVAQATSDTLSDKPNDFWHLAGSCLRPPARTRMLTTV